MVGRPPDRGRSATEPGNGRSGATNRGGRRVGATERADRVWTERPVQDAWPDLTCFGCGPANPEGLQLKSYLSMDGSALVATFHPRPALNAGIPNVAYGGLVASLVDCNSIWAATTFRSLADGRPLDVRPAVRYVTGRLSVEYLKPTPLDRPIHLRSWVVGDLGRKVRVRTELGPRREGTVGDQNAEVAATGPSGEAAATDTEVTATGEVVAVSIRG